MTKRRLSIEEDVCHAWFSNKPSSEDMAWLEIIRKKQSYPDSAKFSREFSFPGVRVIGGSMITPFTFVSHWELSTNYQNNLTVSFQDESSNIRIEKGMIGDGNSFIMEATYDSLYDTIIVHKTDTYLAMLLNFRSNPKIYENTGNAKTTPRATAKHTGFENVGCLNTLYLEFDTSRHQYSDLKLLLSHLICLGFHVAYAILHKTLLQTQRTFFPQTDSFELAYAWKCVQSLGFKVTDHLSEEVKEYLQGFLKDETPLTAQILYNLALRLTEKPFFFFKGEFDLVIRRTQETDLPDKPPPSYCKVPRIVLTPTKLLYLPKEPVLQNRILRQYGEEFFIKVVFRDDDFNKISTIQSYALESLLNSMKTHFKNGFKIHDRHYEFLGCSNSQLREHSFWFFHPHDNITSKHIRKKSGELSSETCVASYVSRFGLCFSTTRKTVEVEKKCVEYRKDVANDKYCFTDGIGCISPHLAKRASRLFYFVCCLQCKHFNHITPALFFLKREKVVDFINFCVCVISKPYFCLFVWSFSSHSRILQSFGDVTIAGEGLQILTYTRHLWPLSSEGSLACHLTVTRGIRL